MKPRPNHDPIIGSKRLRDFPQSKGGAVLRKTAGWGAILILCWFNPKVSEKSREERHNDLDAKQFLRLVH